MTPEQEYIWDRIIPEPNSGCWLWLMAVDPNGYGRCPDLAHRRSYSAFKGKIPKKRDAHHKCYQPGCVNPDHLLALTKSQHMKLEFAEGMRRTQWMNATHCVKGHPFSGANLGLDKSRRCKSGYTRVCKTCRAAKDAKRHKRKMQIKNGEV